LGKKQKSAFFRKEKRETKDAPIYLPQNLVVGKRSCFFFLFFFNLGGSPNFVHKKFYLKNSKAFLLQMSSWPSSCSSSRIGSLKHLECSNPPPFGLLLCFTGAVAAMEQRQHHHFHKELIIAIGLASVAGMAIVATVLYACILCRHSHRAHDSKNIRSSSGFELGPFLCPAQTGSCILVGLSCLSMKIS
jgi:hypothetical protein